MEAAAPPYLLPRPPNITPELRCFLDARFRSPADLAAAADVVAEIHGRCAELEASVSDLSIQLVDATTAYSSSLRSAGSALCGVRGDLAALKVSTSEPGVREEVDVGSEKMLHGQLPALANAVARVEMFRDYAGEYVKMSPLAVAFNWKHFVESNSSGILSFPPEK